MALYRSKDYPEKVVIEKGWVRFGGFHAVIGFDGIVYESLPRDEVAYGCGTTYYENYTDLGKRLFETYGSPNYSTYNIEFCHPDKTGKPSETIYRSLIDYVSYLLNEFNLSIADVVKHSDIVSPAVKQCPLYYVNRPEEWQRLLFDIQMRSVLPMNEETRQAAIEAIKQLSLKGFVSNPEYWIEALSQPIPGWAFFIIMDRIVNDYGDKIDDFDKILGGKI